MNRIAFDTSSLALTGGGTATYLRELMKALGCLDNDICLSMHDYPPFFSRSRKVLRVLDTLNRELIWQQRILPLQAKKTGAAILHSPAMICPLACDVPIVLTVLDAYIVRSPRSFSFWQRTMMNHLFPRCIERADRIIAISNFTKNEILDLYPHIPEEKIFVTWLGVHERFRITPKEHKETIRRKYCLDKPFILSVSTIEPRKNLKTLIMAFARIKDKIDHDLVLIGAYGWNSKDLYSMISDLKLNDRIRFPGYVDIEELPVIYNLADVFVYPSLYEGFGLPPLEAMACGCPVITSNVASLPEVVGDAAETLDPLDIEALEFSIKKMLHDVDVRNKFIEKGLQNIKHFTWEQCAAETVKVYNSLR
jgi:glycosyltransferase involved in cell wall biosynthesis